MGQGLASCYPALQVRRRHGVAIGGDDEAAGLDEEPGLLGLRILFEEGDGGVVGGMMLSKLRQGRISVSIGEGRVATSLEEEVDDGFCLVLVFGGAMKCCHALIILHVDSGSNAQVLQQACHIFDDSVAR